MATDVNAINNYLQEQLARRAMDCVTAVEAAEWLDSARLLDDSPARPGLPLRKLLRAQKIRGQRQEPNGRWYIVRIGSGAGGQAHHDSSGEQAAKEWVAGRAPRRGPGRTSQRDETYVIDLCDELLGQEALRQHRFDFLHGDTGRRLPVDAYYPALRLVIEYREPQHTQPMPFFDKPRRLTVSGVHRGEQRALYDRRRRTVLPQHGIDLVEVSYDELVHKTSGKLVRDWTEDLRLLSRKLARWLDPR